VPVLTIIVDADGCPVKEEVYRVAKRYGLKVVLVANKWMRAPESAWLELVIVDPASREADDWIVEHVAIDDVVVTPDIPLAAACLERGARVISPRGRAFTEESVGDGLATREFLAYLRSVGMASGGPPAMTHRDRSQFLHMLDEVVQSIRRTAHDRGLAPE
jgi:hypothetical protein